MLINVWMVGELSRSGRVVHSRRPRAKLFPESCGRYGACAPPSVWAPPFLWCRESQSPTPAWGGGLCRYPSLWAWLPCWCPIHWQAYHFRRRVLGYAVKAVSRSHSSRAWSLPLRMWQTARRVIYCRLQDTLLCPRGSSGFERSRYPAMLAAVPSWMLQVCVEPKDFLVER